MAEYQLHELASHVGGRIVGSPETRIKDAAPLATAGPHDITFATSAKFAPQIQNALAAAIILPEEISSGSLPAIYVSDARAAFAKIVGMFRIQRNVFAGGVHPTASIADSANIGNNVSIGPGAVVGDDVTIEDGCQLGANVCVMAGSKIGENSTLFPNVVLYENSVIGQRVTLHAGAVIGAFGFGYDTVQGQHLRGEQLGYVCIEDDVEIGANTTIDRGTYGPTRIGRGTKIDNLVMIAHNCQIGRHNLICSQVGVAGSSQTGDYVVMAGQVGVPDHVTIGERSILGAKSGIMRDVPPGSTVIGIPATPERDQMAKQAAFAKLPEMRKQLRALQKQVDALTNQSAAQKEAA